tara:strand:+ start:4746 stop:5429 length:684 start_codon:yes stop_codon:yes gene_type:complete
LHKYEILNMSKIIYFIFFIFLSSLCTAQNTYDIAVLKYNGGGDWYANPTALKNLIKFTNKNIGTNIKEKYKTVEASDPDVFNYPFIHMTGHGNVIFDNQEAENLRRYLIAGGFIHIDDNYGMDIYIRSQLKKVFPELDLVELPKNHKIFNQSFEFKNGLPKIHEHNGNPAQALAIIHDGRIVCLYTFESDLSDGWEDKEVHNDSYETRQKALKMGSNIIEYIFKGDN